MLCLSSGIHSDGSYRPQETVHLQNSQASSYKGDLVRQLQGSPEMAKKSSIYCQSYYDTASRCLVKQVMLVCKVLSIQLGRKYKY